MLHLEPASPNNSLRNIPDRKLVGVQYQDKRTVRFEELLSETIHESLRDVLGGGVRGAIYEFMEREYSVPRNDLPKHLDELFTVFQQNFGLKAKDVIARAFAKKLYAKLNFEFHPIPKFGFTDYLTLVKRRMAERGTDYTQKPASTVTPNALTVLLELPQLEQTS